MERKLSISEGLIELANVNGSSVPVTMRRLEFFESLKCSQCAELIFPPIKDCSNGHHICCICMPQVDSCPAEGCSEKAGTNRNTFAEDFLDRYLQRCENHGRGCTVFFWKEKSQQDLLQAHESSCKFRKLQCWVPNCDTKVLGDTFLFQHWELGHDLQAKGHKEIVYNFMVEGSTSPVYEAQCFRLCHDGNNFLCIFERMLDPKSVLVYTYGYTGTPEALTMYEVSIGLKVEESESHEGESSTSSIFQWNGPLCHSGEEPSQNRTSHKEFFHKLPTNSNLLRCSVSIKVIPRNE